MAYMRGNYYIYRSGGWKLKPEDEPQECIAIHVAKSVDPDMPSVILPMDVFDALVAMRWHQLSPEQQTELTKRVAEEYGGNFGAEGLRSALGYQGMVDQIADELNTEDHGDESIAT